MRFVEASNGMRPLSRTLVVAVAAALLALAPGAQAAVVGAPPTWPIPADVPVGPPPIPSLPPATDAPPPADQIADPVTAGAGCGAWHLQSTYGDLWPVGSTWWEYRCTYQHYEYYPHPCPGTGACDAVCYGYPFDCYSVTEDWADYFYWDGTRPVFYGESYSYAIDDGYSGSAAHWWDAPTARWYALAAPPNVAPTASFSFTCAGLTCAVDGSASTDGDGSIVAFSWTFGDGSSATGAMATHTYASAGGYHVTLTLTDDDGAAGTATKFIVLDPPNAPPTASFTFSCTGLRCTYDGSSSTDTDGAVSAYGWTFGDGGTGNGVTAMHTYGHGGTYSASLTVRDDRGASATVSKDISVANLTPTAAFTVSCSGLRCSLDAGVSGDRDGSIVSYGWTFGDGVAASGKTTSHDYPKAGTYAITVTVTDNDGAAAAASQRINPIALSARGYKQGGQQKVDLSWNGIAGASFDVYRDGARVGVVQGTAYTDVVPKGSHLYRVCATAEATCSTDVTVTS
jgi:PKD repeat protein